MVTQPAWRGIGRVKCRVVIQLSRGCNGACATEGAGGLKTMLTLKHMLLDGTKVRYWDTDYQLVLVSDGGPA